MVNSNKIGEVIEANTTEFLAQCYELHQAPPLGSLVRIRVPQEIYGVVYNAATTSIEPGRRPLARGKEEEKEENVYKSNPQLAQLLRTDFNALVVGYKDDGHIYHYLPPQPATIHSFVYLCEPEEVREFTQDLEFLPLLLGAKMPGVVEELVAAFLRYASRTQQEQRQFLIRAGKELAQLLSGDLNRLNTILRRIKP